jgi:succinylarginine dihydrolase
MKNGGGPACLRLRVVLTDQELTSIHQSILLSDALFNDLTKWINRNYRESIKVDDLRDPEILDESHRALDELTTLLKFPAIYDFQFR